MGIIWTEDVAGGLRRALDMEWTANGRCIVHFFDAPPHGATFHRADVLDNYPEVSHNRVLVLSGDRVLTHGHILMSRPTAGRSQPTQHAVPCGGDGDQGD